MLFIIYDPHWSFNAGTMICFPAILSLSILLSSSLKRLAYILTLLKL